MKSEKTFPYSLNVRFAGMTEEKIPEQAMAYASEHTGELLASAPVEIDGEEGRAQLQMPADSEDRSLRFVVGPPLAETDSTQLMSAAWIERNDAVSTCRTCQPNAEAQLQVLPQQWECWSYVLCPIRGRVVRHETQPDGTRKQLPICNARVLLYTFERQRSEPEVILGDLIEGGGGAEIDPGLIVAPTPTEFDIPSIFEVDQDGKFGALWGYWCRQPGLHFQVEQNQGGTWKKIHEVVLYDCSREIVMSVTDPSALACKPDETVEVPRGVGTYIMPYAVGNMKIWGSPPGGAGTAPLGWVKSDGLADYVERSTKIEDAPFGGHLGFRFIYSSKVPTRNVAYYRWSFRKLGGRGAGTGKWQAMDRPVTRRYMREVPGQLPTFPRYLLGPKDVGSSKSLFEFKPVKPPAPESSDIRHTWPGGSFSDDVHDAYLDTTALGPDVAGAAGEYEIQLEIFDEKGNQVRHGRSNEGFEFIVAKGTTGRGALATRETAGKEVRDGAFVFKLHVDNNQCGATIEEPKGLLGTDCGLLRYSDLSVRTEIAFSPSHPRNHAYFSFHIAGAKAAVPPDSVTADVTETAPAKLHGYQKTAGSLKRTFTVKELLGPCDGAAFAQVLGTYAKATTGYGRIRAYDASEMRPFALAKVIGPPLGDTGGTGVQGAADQGL